MTERFGRTHATGSWSFQRRPVGPERAAFAEVSRFALSVRVQPRQAERSFGPVTSPMPADIADQPVVAESLPGLQFAHNVMNAAAQASRRGDCTSRRCRRRRVLGIALIGAESAVAVLRRGLHSRLDRLVHCRGCDGELLSAAVQGERQNASRALRTAEEQGVRLRHTIGLSARCRVAHL